MSEAIGEEATQRISERLNQYMRETGLISTAPSYRYFMGANGSMYCWTTERADQTDDDEKGWYASFIYRSYGPGSRSGKAKQWKPDMKTMRRHRKRKDAKARALKLYRAAGAKG
jgi:hypothetical protein